MDKDALGSSTGAVCIKGLSGENLANAMMKAEIQGEETGNADWDCWTKPRFASIENAKPFEEMKVAEFLEIDAAANSQRRTRKP